MPRAAPPFLALAVLACGGAACSQNTPEAAGDSAAGSQHDTDAPDAAESGTSTAPLATGLPDTTWPGPLGLPEDCEDGIDDDGDGAVDCDDPGCFGHPACPEVCGDGLDNDGDGEADCGDTDCFGPDCEEDCTTYHDEDGDGLIRCADGDCIDHPDCVEACEDGFDNDLDGVEDCDDDDCWGTPACPKGTVTVTGGTVRLTAVDHYSTVRIFTYGYLDRSTAHRSIEASFSAAHLSGTAQLTVSYEALACGWTLGAAVGTARWSNHYTSAHTYLRCNTPVRSSFSTTGGCGGRGTSMLPAEVAPIFGSPVLGCVGSDLRSPWYLGVVTASTRITTSYTRTSTRDGPASSPSWSHSWPMFGNMTAVTTTRTVQDFELIEGPAFEMAFE